MEFWALLMFPVLGILLLSGYPVAFILGAVALGFGLIFLETGFFDLLPLRIWGVMTNFSLLAVPLFIFMGMLLNRSGLAEELLESAGLLLGNLRGGLALAGIVVGVLLSATTGVVGATVVTMGIIVLPTMLKHGYSVPLATGTIAAAGTLGQIIPPSIILILLGDIMGVPVGRLFIAALVPGLGLVFLYIAYVLVASWLRPELAPSARSGGLPADFLPRMIRSLLPPLLLILGVLGSIFLGVASPTESAAIGAIGAMLLAACKGRLHLAVVREASTETLRLTSMVFLILIGATAFGLVFRGMGGDQAMLELMSGIPGGSWGFLLASMALIFLLGMFLDFIEICFIVVPILTPIAIHFGLDPLWFAVLIALNLQSSFMTPPFGFSLFYLKSVAPPHVRLGQLYRGVIPFIVLQLAALTVLIACPRCATWLPDFVDRLQGL